MPPQRSGLRFLVLPQLIRCIAVKGRDRTSWPLAAPSLTGDAAAIANWLFMSRNGAHMPRSAWRCHLTNLSNSSASITPLYPAALKRSADDWMIAPDQLEHNLNASVLHNIDGVVEKNARSASKMRRAKVRTSSAEIMQEHRQASVPGDGASIFWRMWKKQV